MSTVVIDWHVLVRFFDKIEVRESTGCWEWTASRDHQGYARFSFEKGKTRKAIRPIYEFFVGPIPQGMGLDHFLFPGKCIGPPCINPDHLRPTTTIENLLRGDTLASKNAAKTHCPKGHPLSGENFMVVARRRRCRTCEQDRAHAIRRIQGKPERKRKSYDIS